ncbi:oxidoreductase [Pseudoxanthomonas sp. Root630]|uniref:oxidoreductase n=1 Tax=Pseudoxanthomonas sp. Root630 TaxID=1736574 RepID=UPI00070363DF|nr:oxidoreductase [Pseudoxanthomonas sp. Root630]KRA50868.1 short-chain dehydrogenase [Pseudoxanthomonas sp. Root630]
MKKKVVLVTGVSSGIGRASARALADEGFTVYGSVRQLEHAEPVKGVTLVQLDVRVQASVDHAVASIISKEGRIDVLVNSAGQNLVGSVEETSIDEAEDLFDTNVFGVMRVIRAVLPHMRSQRSGKILNVSSVLGFLPAPYMGVYSASKHAVEGLSESLDHELRQFGVRVTLVQPSFTNTNFKSNTRLVQSTVTEYDRERDRAIDAIGRASTEAPDAALVADTIMEAVLGGWQMRRTPKGQASLLAKLRRFMPFKPVDASLRRTFGLA